MIQSDRIKDLNKISVRQGKYVVYWMQASQRADDNYALEFAVRQANELRLPLIVYFGITDNFPDANLRHYTFMLEGLKEVSRKLKDRGIKFIIRNISPEKGLIALAKNASLVVVDRGYLQIQKKWYKTAAEGIRCKLYQVESDVVFPVETVSGKEEFSAGTIRRKIQKLPDSYFMLPKENDVKIKSLSIDEESVDISDISAILKKMKIDRSVKSVSEHFSGGTNQAKKLLKEFIENKLDKYDLLRNDPALDYQSDMSPYLHFGQISPVYVAGEIMKSKLPGRHSYLEEMVVRRELAMNFVHYNEQYDNFACLNDWAKKTLLEHQNDPREYLYTPEQLEKAETHDPYWNAAQSEMVKTGKMHGYMRMYWGKKILEWMMSPEKAFETAVYLNNKYELDGRDPNGFAGVAWCFGKHDRAWNERSIFGKIRYMNANGLKRKFDIEKYVEKVKKIISG